MYQFIKVLELFIFIWKFSGDSLRVWFWLQFSMFVLLILFQFEVERRDESGRKGETLIEKSDLITERFHLFPWLWTL